MKASSILISKIKVFEGCRLIAYKDSVGVLTIGYGHTKGVKERTKITQSKADELLQQDINEVINALSKLNLPLDTQGKQDALIDWCFNFGVGRLVRGSDGKPTTLYKKIKERASDAEIQAQFKRWCYAGGKPLKGLITRRAWEAQRWTDKD